jgi:hypothetical protein
MPLTPNSLVCHPERSEAKPRDLFLSNLLSLCHPERSEAKSRDPFLSNLLSLCHPERSEAKSRDPFLSNLLSLCHPERSEAQPRDLCHSPRTPSSVIPSEAKRSRGTSASNSKKTLCHPEQSKAEWSDLCANKVFNLFVCRRRSMRRMDPLSVFRSLQATPINPRTNHRGPIGATGRSRSHLRYCFYCWKP